MRFFKYTGLGNDFLIFENAPFDSKTIQELTDRHFGIGADGILFVDTDSFSFSIYNSDGQRAKMCGNGLRCVARYLYDSGKVEEGVVFEIKSNHAVHLCKVTKDEVSCTLSEPILRQKDPYLVDAGTLHIVLFEKPDLKKALHYRKKFNANVNFIFDDNHIHTFEKGIEDFSFACGTGALSYFFMLNVNELELIMRSGKPLRFFKEKSLIWMVGKCQKVFEGTIEKACLEPIFLR